MEIDRYCPIRDDAVAGDTADSGDICKIERGENSVVRGWWGGSVGCWFRHTSPNP